MGRGQGHGSPNVYRLGLIPTAPRGSQCRRPGRRASPVGPWHSAGPRVARHWRPSGLDSGAVNPPARREDPPPPRTVQTTLAIEAHSEMKADAWAFRFRGWYLLAVVLIDLVAAPVSSHFLGTWLPQIPWLARDLAVALVIG